MSDLNSEVVTNMGISTYPLFKIENSTPKSYETHVVS